MMSRSHVNTRPFYSVGSVVVVTYLFICLFILHEQDGKTWNADAPFCRIRVRSFRAFESLLFAR